LKLIKKLQECSTIGQADPILTRLNAGPAVKKLVETAIILSNSQDPQQRSHAYSFMESAIKELEDEDDHKEREESPMGMHGHEDGLANKTIGEEEEDDDHKEREEEEDFKDRKMHEKHDEEDEHKVHEEELSNHNQGKRTSGSEQSTDNEEPYPGEGEESADGEKPMQDMDGTVNQWNETGGMIVPGLPPVPNGMPPNGAPPNGMPPNGAPPNGAPPQGGPGLAPDIAQEMGMVMPQPPPLDTNQMMRQMQYTLNDYHKRYISPLNRLIKQQKETLHKQKEAIKKLSTEIQETRNASGSMKLDLDHMRENATAKFRETESVPNVMPNSYSQFSNLPGVAAVQPVPNIKRNQISSARYEIEEMDKILRSKTSMYN